MPFGKEKYANLADFCVIQGLVFILATRDKKDFVHSKGKQTHTFSKILLVILLISQNKPCWSTIFTYHKKIISKISI